MVIKINQDKKAQVSIFIIIGVILVAAIVLFFAVSRGPSVFTGQELNPENFIDSCLRDSVREDTDKIMEQGGLIEPTDFRVFDNVKATYLCKNVNYYEPCIVQHPNFISGIEKEITDSTKTNVEECFLELERELEERNYEFNGGEIEIETVLKPGSVEVTAGREFSFEINKVSRNFDSFEVSVQSPLYDVAYVANEIVSQEANFCYFENTGFNILYPEFDVRRNVLSDSTKIYTIIHKFTGEEMNIAIRGCAIPPGI